MFFAKTLQPNDTYDFCDVFGRDCFYYKYSTSRIVGWETPISLIYRDGKELKIRFKKEIEKYAEGFKDAPPPFPGIIPEDVRVQRYNEEQPLRRLAYAVEQYKKTRPDFLPIRLTPEELEEKLQTEALLPAATLLKEDLPLLDASSLWLPIDVDAVIIDFLNNATIKNEAALLFADGSILFGILGFDGKFYRPGFYSSSNQFEVYSLLHGVRKEDTPQWLEPMEHLGIGYYFLKNYVITPGGNCYGYNGEFFEQKTVHHRNIKLMNDLIKLLLDLRPQAQIPQGPYTRLTTPESFQVFPIDAVERVIAPHLASKNALNKTAFKQFLNVKRLIQKVGLGEDFEPAFRNILALNKSRVYGGSGRNICSEALLSNLQRLYRKLGAEEMATTLQNQEELKRQIAQIKGIPLPF